MEKQQKSMMNERLFEHILSMRKRETWRKSIDYSDASIELLKEKVVWQSISEVILVGHGTSYATAVNAESLIVKIAKCKSRALPAFRFAQYHDNFLIDPHSTLVVGISCSGNTKSVVDSLEIAKKRGAQTMIVSRRGDIDASRFADYRIETFAQIESEAKVQAYSISHLYMLAALFFFSLTLGEMKQTINKADSLKWKDGFNQMLSSLSNLDTVNSNIEQIVQKVKQNGLNNYAVLGTGPNYGTMIEGALKICEFSWVFGAGEELEDFAHGRFREIGSNDLLIILVHSEKTYRKALDLLAGCEVSKTMTLVITDRVTPALKALASFLLTMPRLESEYLTPFSYIFPLWLFGAYLREEGELIGEKRHGLYAVDINFSNHFDDDGHRKN